MSRNEWERGDFMIPGAEWAKFKTAVRDAATKASTGSHELAIKIHADLKAVKGKHPHGLRDAAWEAARKHAGPPSSYYPARYDEDQMQTAVSSVMKGEWGKERLVAPRKMSFPTYGNTTTQIEGSRFSIHFDNEKRRVVWNVHENNHACERARESAVGKAFLKALDAVRWTRGSGGSIIGNDEYNQDAGREYEGGGGSYSKGEWGPDTKPKPSSGSRAQVAFNRAGRW